MSAPRPRRAVAPGHRPEALHPAGTARALFQGAALTASGEALPRSQWERLRARDVAPDTLLAAWEVGRWTDGPLEERRALTTLVVALGEAVDEGSTFLELSPATGAAATRARADGGDTLSARLERLGFDADDAGTSAAFAARLLEGDVSLATRALFGAPGERRPFILAGTALYPEGLWALESRLAETLARRLATPPRRAPGPSPLPAEDQPLGSEQAAAVQACRAQPLTLITGGPGTGKTSTIVALLRALLRDGLPPGEVAIAAPTGRAAQRITEALRAARFDGATAELGASTVHRLLGLRPARRPTLEAEAPEFHAGWRLPHRFVIVDESSMLDLFMMADLTAAVRDDAHLILIGDADQLPSVRLGAVFRDLCAALPTQTRRLTTSYRMNPADAAGAAILRAAQSLQGAEVAPTFTSRRHAHELELSAVEHLPAVALTELLTRWMDDVLGGAAPIAALAACRFTRDVDGLLDPHDDPGPLKAMLAQHARARLLCVTRTADDSTSADALNDLLHQRALRLRPSATEPSAAEEPARDARGFLPGEPVTIQRNDYQRGLWNGDQGVVVSLVPGEGDDLGVAFTRGETIVVHALGEIADNVGLGYAQTVHKAQGSEYDQVALVLPRIDGPLLTREILYTALTRARRGVVIVGDLTLFSQAARRTLARASGLSAKLAAASAAVRP